MTNWYRTGTASLTNGSAAVTGSSTAWQLGAVVGDAFYIDGLMYEITAVPGDTSLTLATTYAGTTGTGKSYAIIPLSSSRNLIANLALTLSDLTEAVKRGFQATSTSSVVIGTGSKTFTVQAGLPILPGAQMVASVSASPSTNWMRGTVTAYSGTTLTMTVPASNNTAGSGTYAAWNLNLSAVI